jgi:hypothetical protein
MPIAASSSASAGERAGQRRQEARLPQRLAQDLLHRPHARERQVGIDGSDRLAERRRELRRVGDPGEHDAMPRSAYCQ